MPPGRCAMSKREIKDKPSDSKYFFILIEIEKLNIKKQMSKHQEDGTKFTEKAGNGAYLRHITFFNRRFNPFYIYKLFSTEGVVYCDIQLIKNLPQVLNTYGKLPYLFYFQ
jgi:hypothetical protein